MFFSHHGIETNRQLLVDAGFAIERAEPMEQDDEDGCFFWVMATIK
jgi:hypothetical protein